MMKTFKVQGRLGLSRIHVGESLSRVPAYIPSGNTPVIITDENIFRIYNRRFPKGPVITIGTGEKIKTLATIEYILRELVRLGCDRSSFILGIGGGIVSDITGFAASIFLRGVKFGFVSTSLLSQVDASVGGKNGVNLDAFKNMVGLFNQPEFVICDIDLLATLPKSEISNGLAEAVKHGLIKDIKLLEFIEANQQKALDLDRDVIFRLVADSVDIKSRVVQKDEHEAGERRKLNFGHTIGHAMEKLDQSGHGRAVSMGMVAASKFSQQKGYILPQEVDRIKELLLGLKLPVNHSFSSQKIIQAASRDKKKQGEDLFFVFLQALGKARVDKINFNEMNAFIRDELCHPE
ncbi:MAG: 3-dehydroquinate synthase [Desulfobacter sp.]|nr:MAG: 3-dehydroquinate synthase [Desulfobacter sp.]